MEKLNSDNHIRKYVGLSVALVATLSASVGLAHHAHANTINDYVKQGMNQKVGLRQKKKIALVE